MKYISSANISAITIMLFLLSIFGFNAGFKLIKEISSLINLPKIAFAGFIAFALVEVIMAFAAKAGIWFSVKGGAMLYSIMLVAVGILLF